jgi:two-component system, NarL family, response regulator
MTSARPIRVLLADDHNVVRFGLAGVINQEDDMEVVAEASNGAQVVELYRKHRPDVTVMDLRMPGVGGVEALTSIRTEDPEARVLVLTIHSGDEAVHRAIRAGARGYLLKDVPFQDLLAAIRAVHAGRRSFPPDVAEKMALRLEHGELLPRELEVLKHIATGLSNKRIADRMDLTESAVKHIVTIILSKMGASDRAHAVALAIDRNIIDLGDVNLRSSGEPDRPR